LLANEKTAIAGGFRYLGLVAFYVTPPLFHRLKAGMAKPKIAGKKSEVAHGQIRMG
jgi:hypothetical protein